MTTAHTPTLSHGHWFVSQEGKGSAGLVVKRQWFDVDGNPAGYQLLDGDYAEIARIVASNAALVAALRDMAMCFGNPRDADVDAWWEFRCDWEQGSDAIRYETLMQARAALAAAKGQA